MFLISNIDILIEKNQNGFNIAKIEGFHNLHRF